MQETELLARITYNPQIFGGKPIIRGRRLAVEHVLGMLATGDTAETLLAAYPWLRIAGSVQNGAGSGLDCQGVERWLKPLLRTWPGSITSGANSRGIGGFFGRLGRRFCLPNLH